MSHRRCIVLDSRITSRPDPASFGPPAGIRFIETRTPPGPADRASNQRSGGGGGGARAGESPWFSRVSDEFRGICKVRRGRALRWI